MATVGSRIEGGFIVNRTNADGDDQGIKTTVKIVVADDLALLRHSLESLLSGWGYEVILCADGDEAWRALQLQSGPIIAVLDWIMPGIEGVDLCRRIQHELKHACIYTILLTARTGEDDVVAGLDAGADAYITKPFNSQDLKARIQAAERILTTRQNLLSRQQVLRQESERKELPNTCLQPSEPEGLSTSV